jgi:hypothetical protein
MLPAKPLLKLDIAVVSHGHADHWHPNFGLKNLVLVPWKATIPAGYNGRNILKVEELRGLGKMSFKCIDTALLNSFIGRKVPTPHAFWWLATASTARVLFIGDMNAEDAETARLFVREARARGLTLAGALLPSFGGVSGHSARDPRELARAVGELAASLREKYGLVIGGLPHPVNAQWANYNAVRI